MIYGIGVDLVSITRIEQVIKKWEGRFVDRVFTLQESKKCYGKAFPYPAFALRFAAKEAFAKAIGTGFRDGLKWQDIEVINDSNGKPNLQLHGKANQICTENDIVMAHISLSDDGKYGIGMVVLEKP